jgi:iron complex transport system substrate-binding protein
LGMATANEERGRALAALYTDKMTDIRRRAASAGTHPKAYIELGQGGAGEVGNTYNDAMWGRRTELAGGAMPGIVFPIGIMTALTGVPFFAWLVLASRHGA